MADKNTVFQQKLSLNVRGNLIDVSKPKVMGILNLTPDSFYDGGRNNHLTSALKKVEEFLLEGADIIDIGAYSSRPAADHISEDEEYQRLIPIVKAVAKEFPKAILSIDTFRSEIAKASVYEGAHIINDISGGQMDNNMFQTIGSLKVPYVLMHIKGTPQNMSSKTQYENVSTEVSRYFAVKIAELIELGVKDIIIDPGFGFAKTAEQSFEILKNLSFFKLIGHPVMAGLSRKSMIYKTLGTDASNALNGTTAANTIALMKGANILRVHDVKAAREAIEIFEKAS